MPTRTSAPFALLALGLAGGCYEFRRTPLDGGFVDARTEEVTDAAAEACTPVCGARCEPCPAPEGGRAVCVDGACGVACDPGYTAQGGGCSRVVQPRLVAPLSASTVTSRRPRLRWINDAGSDGARVEGGRDRACTAVLFTADVTAPEWAPPGDLPPGVAYWRAAGRRGAETGRAWTPTWQFFVGRTAAPRVNGSAGATLDVNGDGYADLGLGAPGAVGGAGEAYVYLGGPSGVSRAPSVTLAPGEPSAIVRHFGGAVASVGDVNGDGYADLGVGAPDTEGRIGRVFFYAGGAGGVARQPSWTLVGFDGANTGFGFEVSAAGDADGDGYGDVAVTTYYLGNYRGRVHVFRGGPRGVEPRVWRTLNTPGGQLTQFGQSMAGADVNGDGFGDLVVSEQGWMGYRGRVLVFVGGAEGLQFTAATVIDGYPGTMGAAGAGDVNGDGYTDVLTGSPQLAGGGRALAFHGGPAGTPTAADDAHGGPGPLFAQTLRGVGDVNGDGYEDALASADDPTHAGAVHLLLGGSDGLQPAIARSWLGPDGPGAHFSDPIAGVGDLDGDGAADFVVGAYRALGDVGRVYLYPGRVGGLPPATPVVLEAPAGGLFGTGVARVY